MRAIAIDEALAEPHAALGYLKTLYEWDWAGAGREFRRAIQLDAGYATTHHWYAFYHQTIGDIPRSLAEIEAARKLDPLSPVINSEIAYFYRFARQYDRAELEGRKALRFLTRASNLPMFTRSGENGGKPLPNWRHCPRFRAWGWFC
jgi:tetratricopeptide (TPR) repeat protein